ncbi:hypothetical protein PCANC_00765 [Puccinia coronata f. sp. avenae]|uniref:Uncharacterized protein n=1 Tax=Puccinia coronata f. sp. avenae TaxID=200324 RepID=A0A2N5W6U0_9BASI|nr:hypothetical protein PCANC_00765 [Puccinia coronata f. sp. avenae]
MGRRTGDIDVSLTHYFSRLPSPMGIPTFCHSGVIHMPGGIYGPGHRDTSSIMGTTPTQRHPKKTLYWTFTLRQSSSGKGRKLIWSVLR